MLDFIADRADFIIAGVQTALTLDMLPTIWSQFRARASTVPLTSSVPTAVGLAVLGLVFFSTGLFIATGTVLVGSLMWSVVAAQRVGYNRDDGSTTQAPVADPELRIDDSRVSGSSPVEPLHVRYEESECGCVHHARAGRCRHRPSPAGRSARQATGVGVDGDSQSDAPSVEEVPSVLLDPFATTHDQRGDRIKLEEE